MVMFCRALLALVGLAVSTWASVTEQEIALADVAGDGFLAPPQVHPLVALESQASGSRDANSTNPANGGRCSGTNGDECAEEVRMLYIGGALLILLALYMVARLWFYLKETPKNTRREENVTCPDQGHTLVKYAAIDQVATVPCATCGRTSPDYVWSCECNHLICHRCWQVATSKLRSLSFVPLRELPANAIIVEVVLTEEVLLSKGNMLQDWFQYELWREARHAGVQHSCIPLLEKNMVAHDVDGMVYSSYEDLVCGLRSDLFPVVLMYSTHPFVAPGPDDSVGELEKTERIVRNSIKKAEGRSPKASPTSARAARSGESRFGDDANERGERRTRRQVKLAFGYTKSTKEALELAER